MFRILITCYLGRRNVEFLFHICTAKWKGVSWVRANDDCVVPNCKIALGSVMMEAFLRFGIEANEWCNVDFARRRGIIHGTRDNRRFRRYVRLKEAMHWRIAVAKMVDFRWCRLKHQGQRDLKDAYTRLNDESNAH